MSDTTSAIFWKDATSRMAPAFADLSKQRARPIARARSGLGSSVCWWAEQLIEEVAEPGFEHVNFGLGDGNAVGQSSTTRQVSTSCAGGRPMRGAGVLT